MTTASDSGVGADRIYRCRVCNRTWKGSSAVKPESCADCGAKRITATAVIAGTAEYATADRSQGYAIEDIRFGKLAQWTGQITANQFEEALAAQRQAVGAGRTAQPLGNVLVKMRALTRRQVEAVLQVRGSAWQDASEESFGELVASKNLLARQQLLESKKAQMEFAEQGQTPPPLALLLYEKRLVPEAGIEILLKAMAQRGRGLAAQVERELAQHPTRIDTILGPSGSKQRKARLIGVAALAPVVALLLYFSFVRGPALNVATMCGKCHRVAAAPVSTSWPAVCTACKAKEVYPMRICRRCGAKFTVKKLYARGVKCPNCYSDDTVDLTSDINEKEILSKVKRPTGGKRR